MNQANKWFDYAAAGYCFLVGLTITGTLMRVFHSDNLAFFLMPLMSLYSVCLIYVSCTVLRKNRYLVYFRIFNRKDIRWHEKWRYWTYVYTLGGILGLIGGVSLFVTITAS